MWSAGATVGPTCTLHACAGAQEFVVSVHARAAEAGGAAALSKRGQSMLELVVDIKNNRWVLIVDRCS